MEITWKQLLKNKRKMKKTTDLKNKKFGRLFVIKKIGKSDYFSRERWQCLCDCGSRIEVIGRNLIAGHTKSCGCLKKEGCHKTHGLTKHPMYIRWRNINNRCYNNSANNYHNYGGRGIKNFWKNDFVGFYNYVTKLNNYGKGGLSLDRINNNKDYKPNNLRWATRKEQSTNTRCNVKYKGETMKDASFRLGGGHSLVRSRITNGWSKRKAFTMPVLDVKTKFKTYKHPIPPRTD